MNNLTAIKINLFTSYFDSGNSDRQIELDFCLKKNIENKFIDKIFLFHESGEKTESDKVKITGHTRPTFSDFFKCVRKQSGVNEINIISNSDIYFNDSLLMLKHIFGNNKNLCLALSRSDLVGDILKPWHSRDSQDAWILFGKPRKISGAFYLGKPGSDNRIAYELNRAGYQLINLCTVITIIHVHNSQVKSYNRNKNETIPYPYLFLEPQ